MVVIVQGKIKLYTTLQGNKSFLKCKIMIYLNFHKNFINCTLNLSEMLTFLKYNQFEKAALTQSVGLKTCLVWLFLLLE